MRPASFCCALAALSLFLIGCREFPIARGPEYRLPERERSGILQTGGIPASRMPLELRDGRPAWETHYYAPATEPAAWRRAVGFVAMENVQPSLRELILGAVNDAGGAMTSAPSWGIVEIDSFRIVVNNSEQKHREYEERRKDLELELERDRQPTFLLGVTNGGAVGFGFGSSLERRPGLRAATPSPSDAEPWIVPGSRIVNGQKELVGPPKELTLKYGPGVTCELSARIELYWPGGRTETFHVAAASRADVPDWAVYDITADIPKAVYGALDDLRAKLAQAERARSAARGQRNVER